MFEEFERFSENAKKSFVLAGNFARKEGFSIIDTDHLLLGILVAKGSLGSQILENAGLNFEKLNTLNPSLSTVTLISSDIQSKVQFGLTDNAKKSLVLAYSFAHEFGHPYVGTEHLLLSLISQRGSKAVQLLRQNKIDILALREELENYLGNSSNSFDQFDTLYAPVNQKGSKSKTPLLDNFSINLNAKAKEGGLDPVIGREKEISRVISILNRRNKNNPVLIGDPGVGKTAIVEGLAQKIVLDEVPETLQDKVILMLDLAGLIAGTKYRGEFEDRLKKILVELKNNKNTIVFIDEVHTVVGAGAAEGAMDAANILKPALSRGEIRCIGATTLDEYRKHIEKDAALERRFQPVIVVEPTVEETIAILKGIKGKYEEYHKVKILDESLEAAAKLSKRFIADRFLPDKAIDLIDEAASLKRIKEGTLPPDLKDLERKLNQIVKEKEETVLSQDYEAAARLRSQEIILEDKIKRLRKQKGISQNPEIIITDDDISLVAANITGIPITRLVKAESKNLLYLEKALKQRIIGQDEATRLITSAIKRSRTGVSDEKRPIGSFMFLGPTGVGKTELAKVLASEIFGSEDVLLKVDMSEFMEKHNVSRLVGAPAGYVGYEEGGQLTEKVRRQPYSVILFDEIEKAHPDVFNMLLQILEDGYLTDAKGVKVDFRNTIIILTSNVGATDLRKESSLGFKAKSKNQEEELNEFHQKMKERLLSHLKKTFKPEFLNRLDQIVIFRALSPIDVKKIVSLELRVLEKRLAEQQIQLNISEKVKDFLVSQGYDPENGARPLKRAIQRLVEDPLASGILNGEFKPKDIISLAIQGDKITFKALEKAK